MAELGIVSAPQLDLPMAVPLAVQPITMWERYSAKCQKTYACFAARLLLRHAQMT